MVRDHRIARIVPSSPSHRKRLLLAQPRPRATLALLAACTGAQTQAGAKVKQPATEQQHLSICTLCAMLGREEPAHEADTHRAGRVVGARRLVVALSALLDCLAERTLTRVGQTGSIHLCDDLAG